MAMLIAEIWFASEIKELRARELAETYDVEWSDVETEYGIFYGHLEQLSNGTH